MGLRDSLRSIVIKGLNIPQAKGWWWKAGDISTEYEINESYADYEKAYKEHVWVQRCINLRASCIASVPIRLYKYSDKTREEIKSHPLLALLDDVNPLTMNASELWIATEAGKCIYGNAYWYLERRGGQEPREIYCLKPKNMVIHGASQPDKYIDYFEYQTDNVQAPQVKYSPRDIIHFRNFNPASEYYGLSNISCIREAISADLYAQAYNKNFFRNSARPDGIVMIKGSLTEEQRKLLRKSFESQFRGVAKAHRLAVLEEGQGYQQISATPKDAEWNELRKACREAICSALGVPPVLVVAYEAATYATAYEQKKSLWHETIIPELHYFEEVMNWNLIPQFKNSQNLKLEFDLSDVPALQEEASEKADRLVRATGAPYLTPNEAREIWGLPPIAGGHKLYAPLNMEPIEEEKRDDKAAT